MSCSNQLSYFSYFNFVLLNCGKGGTRTRDPVVMSEVTLFYDTCVL